MERKDNYRARTDDHDLEVGPDESHREHHGQEVLTTGKISALARMEDGTLPDCEDQPAAIGQQTQLCLLLSGNTDEKLDTIIMGWQVGARRSLVPERSEQNRALRAASAGKNQRIILIILVVSLWHS